MPSSRSGHQVTGVQLTGKPANRTDKLRVLFAQGWCPRDAAEIAQTTARYARKVRDQQRSISAGMTLRQEVSRLRQDLSDLRRLTLSHIEQSRIENSRIENSNPKLEPKNKPGPSSKLRRVG